MNQKLKCKSKNYKKKKTLRRKYSAGNSTQFSVITCMGKESEKEENMYMYN